MRAEAGTALIWIAGTDMRATWFNKYWLNFVGKPMASEVGGGWMDSLYPEDRRPCMEQMAEALEDAVTAR